MGECRIRTIILDDGAVAEVDPDGFHSRTCGQSRKLTGSWTHTSADGL
jgi:hypothetical protein